MCRSVYIAADSPLPLIEWKENISVFSISELTEKDLPVLKQFTKKHVVHAGSFEGCSCGFAYDNEPIEDAEELELDEKARSSVKQLFAYLNRLVEYGPIELFACWDGEQGEEPNDRSLVTPEYFGGDEFGFENSQFFVVTKESLKGGTQNALD